MVDCHKCGQEGHVARDCQWEPEVSARPTWCGECDRQTRLVDHGLYVQRCHRCWAWPSKGTRFHQLLPQHKICGGCKNIVYAFDAAACGKHQPLAIGVTGHRTRQAITKEEPGD